MNLKEIATALWQLDLRDIALRPGLPPAQRVLYKLIITAETLLESVWITLVLLTVGLAVVLWLPPMWAFRELRELWRPSC